MATEHFRDTEALRAVGAVAPGGSRRSGQGDVLTEHSPLVLRRGEDGKLWVA
jgi:hypothetical protein